MHISYVLTHVFYDLTPCQGSGLIDPLIMTGLKLTESRSVAQTN